MGEEMVFRVKPIKEIKIYRERNGESIYWDSLKTYGDYLVFADDLTKAKKSFVQEKGLKSSRNLEFEEVSFKEGFETLRGDETVYVFYNGELVYDWADNAQSDYPEDLCWSRMISEVFYSGVELGKKISNAR